MTNENENLIEEVAFEEQPLDAGDFSYLVQLVAYDLLKGERNGDDVSELAEIFDDHQRTMDKLKFVYEKLTAKSINYSTFEDIIAIQKKNVDQKKV